MRLVETLRRETRSAHDAIEAAVDVERTSVSRDADRRTFGPGEAKTAPAAAQPRSLVPAR